MIAACPHSTLNDVVSLLCVKKFNDRRKYFKEYLILAQEVWKELFVNTLFVTKNVYLELKKGDGFNYIDIPSNCLRFLSAGVKDRCDILKPLYYNQDLVVTKKPTIKPCGCNACNCASDGLCDSVNSLSVTTKEVVINDVTYTEYTWISVCPNGDIMEYRQIPTTAYSFTRGSYDVSYDISYEIGSSDSEVVVYTLVRKLCKLAVKPCGCPEQTPENEQLFYNSCGCFLNPCTRLAKKCVKYWGDCSQWAGECKISECGTRLEIRHVQDLSDNHQILLTYQTNGVEIDGEIMVPNYANQAIHVGVEYQKILFSGANPRVIQDWYYKAEDEKDKITIFLNRISLEQLEFLPQMAKW